MEPHKVLIIEDDPAILSMLQTIFTHRGFLVDTSNNGSLGLGHAQTGGYDAIILDLKMPQMDGLAFLKQLRARPPQTPNRAIVVYSSAGYDYARQEAARLGVDLFIPKDETKPSALVDQVQVIISQPRKGGANGR